jgi:hypothetical protein
MDLLRLPTSRLTRRLALLPGLLLLLALVAGGVHHHAREDGSHACAICTLSHAPATATVAAIEPAPTLTVERVAPTSADVPRSTGPVSPSSRAPPSI